jgi:pseudouridine-5'-monophosphatase
MYARFMNGIIAEAVMPHPAEQHVTHLLFDMEGLLQDTEPLYTAATEVVAARHGSTDPSGLPLAFTWDLKVRQMGLPSDELAKLVVQELRLPISPEQYTREVKAIQQETFPHCQLLPGAEGLVRYLHSLPGVQIAVATSSPRDTYELKTTNHKELFSLFHHVVCGSTDPEVERGKPAPDIFLVCARRFSEPEETEELGISVTDFRQTTGPHPASCLVVEDSPAGARAALAAGMRCLMVPDARMFDTPDHIPTGVTLVIRSLEELQPAELMTACNAYW